MKILDRLPIPKDHTSLGFNGRNITVRPSQILVWVSVHLSGVLLPEDNIPGFPALLDTGNNFGFSMQERHLREWAGIAPGLLEAIGGVTIERTVVACRKATVWLYPNMSGRQDVASGRLPFELRMPKGIAVYARDQVPPGPRLPLLGLPALLDNDLDCWLDPGRRHVTAQTRSWRRRLIRLLCRWSCAGGKSQAPDPRGPSWPAVACAGICRVLR